MEPMSPSVGRKRSSVAKNAPMRSDSTSTVDTVVLISHTNRQSLNRPAIETTTTTESPSPFEFNAMKRQLYKTKMCRHYLNGKCKYNKDCTFSHDRSELLVRKDMAKTKLCKKPHCSDPNCAYAHSVVEIRDATNQMCPQWLHYGTCPNGNACRLSHNSTYLEELAVATSVPTPSPTPGLTEPNQVHSATDLVDALLEMLSNIDFAQQV